MTFPIGAGSALEPRTQSTRAALPLARGYTPPAPKPLVAVAFRAHRALRARMRSLTAKRYGDGEIYLAFVGGIVIAACVFVPFLPRLSF
jgi:hypothetical protein